VLLPLYLCISYDLTDACDMYSCGGSYRGMLGHGEEEMERIPRVINALLGRNIIYIVCGVAHTIALSGVCCVCVYACVI